MPENQVFLASHTPFAATDWMPSGSGILTWSVFSIYRATLWQVGPLSMSAAAISEQPPVPRISNPAFALQFEYLRNVSADYIIEASQRELKRLALADSAQIATWILALREIIADAGRGDLLWIVFTPSVGVRFLSQRFSQSELLGDIADADFCQAFADIWFHPDCHSAKLRRSLLQEASA